MGTKRIATTKKASITRPRRGQRALPPVIQFKITLDHIEPPIWRRILLTGDLTFADVHLILQAAMGWQNSHLHEFRLGDRRVGVPDPEAGEIEDERKVRLAQVELQAGETFRYVYDFGDGWTHAILVEKVVPADTRFLYPVCMAGARACPPEDSGGPPGYAEFLRKISDPEDEEHDHMVAWIGGVFDPEGFDVNRTNAALRRGR